MRFTVFWKPTAEGQLASLWNESHDRSAIARAADEVDALLAVDPQSRGESRSGASRVLIVTPLVVAFEVREPDRAVDVLGVRHLPRSKGRGQR